MSIVQILIVFAVIVLPVAAFVGWKMYSKAKAAERLATNFDRALTVMPQLELTLQASTIDQWVDASRIKTDEITLREAGLIHKGYFVNRSSLRKLQVSLWQFKNSLTVALCENQIESESFDDELQTEYSCHAIARLNNGAAFSVTNSPSAKRLRFSEHNPVVISDASDPLSLMRAVKGALPSGTKMVPIEDSKTLFVANYECQSHWLWQSEQLHSEQVRTLLEAHEVDVSDELLEQLQEHADAFLSQIYSHKVLERLGQIPSMDAAQWQQIRGKCVVIHEKMSAEHLSSALFQTLPELTSKQEKELESLGDGGPIGDPITSFQEYLDSFNSGRPTKRIAKMQQPVRAEIYLPE